ncbi:MAG: MBL fold metallo-hydrolase [Burkholderiaceae bacterium]
MIRRSGRLQTLLLVCAVVAGCASRPDQPTAGELTPTLSADCALVDDIPWQAVAPSVWVWLPPGEADVDTSNQGHVVPTAVVVDQGEAIVIDPGPSHRHGQRLRHALACRFGARPTWIVNTHAHAENVLANSAFADLQQAGHLRIGASMPTREAMRARCPDCLVSLTRRVGTQAMQDTHIVLPDVTLTEGMHLRAGRRDLQVLKIRHGHTEGDLQLWDADHGVLFAGGLVYGQRLPELAQGRLDEWLAALDGLSRLPVREVIGLTWSRGGPGHLPPAMASTRDYLSGLRTAVLRAMDEGLLVQDAETVPVPMARTWAGYAQRHGFNVLRAWRELEPVWMEQGSVPAPPAPSVDQSRR